MMVNHEDVIDCFVKPNEATYISVFSLCANLDGSGSIYWGKQIHGHVIRNAIELTALVDLYGKTGCLTSAGYVFKKMVVKEVCTWNAMISALSLNGLFWEAAAVIKSMPFEPDASMLGAILGSCKIHGTAEMGNEVGKKLLELQPQHCGRYVARKAMVDAGIRKISAYSKIDVK
ncbi:hypothetical protein ACFX2J_023931 [Malus domestica]